MKKETIALVALTALTLLATMFVRVPLPSRGYFNFGDVAVVFAGLVLGHMAGRSGWLLGAAAGGVGSALADLIGGFGVFAPITLVAKGLEGFMAAVAASRHRLVHILFLTLGGICMAGVYFLGEVLMPNIGVQGATAEIIPNLVQAVGGAVGGRLTFAAYLRIEGSASGNHGFSNH